MVSILALWALVLFETGLLLLLLRALGELRQKGMLSPVVQSPGVGGLDVGKRAPSFVVTDYDGNPISLEDFRGQRRILAFVLPGCPACVGAIEALNALQESEQDWAVLLIGSPDRELNRAYAAEHHAQMTILTPAPTLASEAYRVQGIPLFFILDEAGIIRAKRIVSQHEHLQALLTTVSPPVPIAR